jgi:uncharacterized protein (DUF4213/DUF364 family)
MAEPLQHFYDKYKIDVNLIGQIITGDCYTAVVLKTGKIGICSNTSYKVVLKTIDLYHLKTDRIQDRIVLNAYCNAIFNYQNEYKISKDVFDFADFSKYENIVMIGFFESTYAKFINAGLKVSVFDIEKTDPALVPISKEMEFVKKADAILMTATTLANNTFLDLINKTKVQCDIFLTGPSAIMHQDMFEYKNISAILGSVFDDGDKRVLDIIKDGGCTRDFIKFGRKVVFEKI